MLLLKVAILLLASSFSYCSLHDYDDFNENSVDNRFRQLVSTTAATEQKKRYTIQFQASPNNQTAVKAEQDAFMAFLKENNVNYTIRYQYTDIINAISLEISPTLSGDHHLSYSDFKPSRFLTSSIQKLSFVQRYWVGRKIARPRTLRYSSSSPSYFSSRQQGKNNLPTESSILPNLFAAHDMTGVSFAKRRNLTGKGIRIGILDTGVDYTHPALGGCFGDNCLIKYGYDLVGDDYGESDSLTPDSDPMDTCDGHGTHVAGIIAARDTEKGFEGVSPDVELGVWRIFGCGGDTDDDIILSAAELAVKAGMDVINLSLGDGLSAWQEDSLAVALSEIVDRGIVVVVAQGNEGKGGISRTPSPSIGEHVFSVASVDNSMKWTRYLNVLDPFLNHTTIKTFEYMVPEENKFDFEGVNNLTFLAEKKNGTISMKRSHYACYRINQNLTGLIVLLKRGKCSFGKKVLYAQKAGAIGVLIYNDKRDDEIPLISLKGYPKITIPVGSLSYSNGVHLKRHFKNLFANQSMSMDLSFNATIAPVDTGGLPSTFSTWGPDPELHFKPDISAVGGYIYSTYPINLGGYSTMSGTSMATPYISGCIALYMQATGIKYPLEIYKALANHAKPALAYNNTSYESPIKQGTGLIQIDKSILSNIDVTPFKLALNDTQFFENNRTIRILNKSNTAKYFSLENIPSIAVSGYQLSKSSVPLETPKKLRLDAIVTFSEQNFTLLGNTGVDIKVLFELPSLNRSLVKKHKHAIYGGFLKINSVSSDTAGSEEAETLHVPYFGSLGKQRDLPIFDTKNGYPYIDPSTKPNLYKPENKAQLISDKKRKNKHRHLVHSAGDGIKLKYNFGRGDTLYMHNRLGSPTAELSAELLNKSNVLVGKLHSIQEGWLSRQDDSDENYETEYDWHGRILTGNGYTTQVNPGIYRIKLSGLKIFGNVDDVNDWENWYSPEIEIVG